MRPSSPEDLDVEASPARLRGQARRSGELPGPLRFVSISSAPFRLFHCVGPRAVWVLMSRAPWRCSDTFLSDAQMAAAGWIRTAWTRHPDGCPGRPHPRRGRGSADASHRPAARYVLPTSFASQGRGGVRISALRPLTPKLHTALCHSYPACSHRHARRQLGLQQHGRHDG